MDKTQHRPDTDPWRTRAADTLSASDVPVQPPELLTQIGRYRVERLAGQGGFGAVYLARDDDLDRSVAVKVAHRRQFSSSHAAAAYLSEARILASLDHPNIVPVYDLGRTPDGLCYVVSKFIEGSDLAGRLQQQRPTYTESARLIAAIADALHHAHRRGLVHRDVKPANILLDQGDKAYISDFGLALREEDFGTGAGFAGTPAYMSPEQARGEGHRVDGRSDIFSLGAVLYEMLTGRRPFHAESQQQLLQQIATQEIRPPRQLDDQIPRELERICLKAMSKRATDRYTTALDLADDLRHFLAQPRQPHNPLLDTNGFLLEQGVAAESLVAPHAAPVSRVGSSALTHRPPTPSDQDLRIVPKGLRSFDSGDAEFFLELLPGPRDRQGLPDSIRFWLTRIAETDPNQAFSVGLIYGPSGCGKSSFVRAGLLPSLPMNVAPVYIEATPEDTEARLLKGLRRHCPDAPVSAGLLDILAAIRRGAGLPAGRKLLIVIDQFEQWLHAKREHDTTELLQALRQCDGLRVQCIVMVRDDFWMAATRFMRGLEVRLVEGQNAGAVDLFDLRHAKKVLTAFGRAWGALPENADELTAEQQSFLEQAVSGLAQDGHVVPVRLTLFAETFKGKTWTRSNLKAVGGMAGVGVTFLEETFSASSAPMEHRMHQEAARNVLKCLLPEQGSNIKGHMRSRDDLLEASGYEQRMEDFDELLRILDGQLRLITPTDPEGSPTPERHDAGAAGRYYQLTHDYLVPALRGWLTLKMKQNWRGRAELRLEERTSQWTHIRDQRFLPSLLEYISISAGVPRRKRRPEHHELLRAARNLHLTRWGLAMAMLLVCLFVGEQYLRQLRTRNEQQRAATLVHAALRASPDGVPYAIENLKQFKSIARPLLESRFTEPAAYPGEHLHAALALAALGKQHVDYLVEQIKVAPGPECPNLIAALTPLTDAARDDLRRGVQSAADPVTRLRYATVLLHLGESKELEQLLEPQPNPVHRTTLVHNFPSWHGELSGVANVLRDTRNPNLRASLCAAVGMLSPDLLSVEERQTLEQNLRQIYTQAADGGSHSAARWALGRWKAKLPSITATASANRQRRWFVNRHRMTMVEIPAGTFTMGSPHQQEDRNAAPPHPVTISRGFQMADREVSEGLFRQFLNDAKYPADEKPAPRAPVKGQGQPAPDDWPAQSVTWFDALLFCNWLSHSENRTPCYQRTGETQTVKTTEGDEVWQVWRCDFAADGYRLPTEAEWEYACRAGTGTAFNFGDDSDLLPEYAYFIVNAKLNAWPCGKKLPNAWGLFDMHGNAQEWCWDWLGAYSDAAAVDPVGPNGIVRAARGGGFLYDLNNCRTAFRLPIRPLKTNDFFGFRPVCGIPNPQP